MQERHVAGKRTAGAKMLLGIYVVKTRSQHSCRYTSCPFIKITYDDPVFRFQNMTGEQFVNLLASFKERGPHMQIGEVERLSRHDLDLCHKAPARFIWRNRNIVISRLYDRVPANDRVPVIGAFDLSILARDKFKPKRICNKFRLMIAFRTARVAQHFLQPDHISIYLAQNLHDTFRRIFPVDTDALVDIVSGDPQ